MAVESKTIIYPVSDLETAKSLFSELLGVEPYADQPYYVGFRSGDQETGLDPNGHKKGLTGPTPFFKVSDISASITELTKKGAVIQQEVNDVGGGMLIATVQDKDGNGIGLIQPA
jgi:predicted enzyme related to lactoylglutathione lyase